MSHIPAKIVLKSTTSKTLNDRFTEMAKKQIRSPPQVTITGVRSNQFQMSQASMKNRRLAAQMANRPGVQAALGGNTSSLKSRLGSPTRGRGINAKGQLKNRLGTSPTGVVGRTRGRGRGSSFGGGFRQGRGLGSNMRGGVRGKRGGSGVVRGGRGMQGAGRGARGGRGAARGRGRGRGRGDKPVSRDKLDEELDKYMSKTKSHLDAELDEYMQHAEEDNE
ncbi:uncharacterized protein LOC144644937 isoform X2 [Oculina patagonica]